MTTSFLIADLERDEGCRLVAYPDPITRGAPWTIGYGHTGREVHPGLTWTAQQALEALQQDVGAVEAGLDTALPWWVHLSDPRQDVLANMAFNIGVHGLLEFHHMLSACQSGFFAGAAAAMLDSEWADQVKRRAQRLALQLKTGVRAT